LVDGQKVYFSLVYLNITMTVEESAWIRTLRKASSSNRHIFGGINSNAHSNVWGSSTSNPRGLRAKEVLYQNGLCVLNEGNKPTFERARVATHIDIRVASPALTMMVLNWQVMDEMHLSDHHLITEKIHIRPDYNPLQKGWHLKKMSCQDSRPSWMRSSKTLRIPFFGLPNR
jgi:hypothetical protein